MKVIFLDIDGVLNVASSAKDEFGHLFHPAFVSNLDYIIQETGAKIVISSTWRKSGPKVMREMWDHRELPGEIIGLTPETPFIRGEEIFEWIKENQPDGYVIIDDDDDMLDSQHGNFVKTSGNHDHPDAYFGYGLTLNCAEMAIKILKP